MHTNLDLEPAPPILWSQRIATPLLRDGNATPATTFLLVHHGLRRDLRRMFELLGRASPPNSDALRSHWSTYRAILVAHHELEDAVLFPTLRAFDAGLGTQLDALEAEHAVLDELLDGLETALGGDLGDAAARTVARERTAGLGRFLDAHLADEELHVVEPLIAAPPAAGPPGGGFPPALAVGFSLDGVAEEVVAALRSGAGPMADEDAVRRWRNEWDQRRRATWGEDLAVGATLTAEPDAG